MSRRLVGPVVILAVFAALVLAVGPFHNFPVQDDWDYARTVSILMRSGVFERSEIAQASEVFSALWGLLFARLFGFSFDVLRFATLVLSAGALLVFDALLGVLGFDLSRRLAGVATLMVSPLFVFLSFTFMTDVPALFWLLCALYGYVRALGRSSLRWALVGSACAALAFLTRQIGLVAALAAAAYFFARPPVATVRARLAWAAACAALPCVVGVAYVGWTVQSGGVTWANQQLTIADTLSFLTDSQTPGVVARRIAVDSLTVAFYLAPLWLPALPALRWLKAAATNSPLRRALRRPALWVALALGLFLVISIARLALRGEWLPYLTDALTRQGLRPYLGYFAYAGGSFRADVLPLPFWVLLTALAVAPGWLLLTLWLRAPLRAAAPIQFVAWTGLCLAVPTLLFREFYERFLLLFLPPAIILLLDAGRRTIYAPRLALVGAALMALFSLALMKDYWGWMDARWPAAQALVQAGVPLDHIDAGYEWDGWNLYDPSIAAIRQRNLPMQITPWAYILDPDYLFAFAPLPRYHVERTILFASPFGPEAGRFYILRRD